MGYKYSTQAAMTVSISDMTVPPQKPQMIADAQDTVDKITRQYKRGLITDEERYKEVPLQRHFLQVLISTTTSS